MVSAQEFGTFRVVFDNSAETNPLIPIDFHTSTISGGALAPPTGASLDAIQRNGYFPQAGERLVCYFISDATDIVESEESDFEMGVLILDKRTKKVIGRQTLKLAQFTGFTPAGTVDITCTAGTPARLCHINAPADKAYQLDPNSKTRVYIGDDTA